jgi:hypothetical protein
MESRKRKFSRHRAVLTVAIGLTGLIGARAALATTAPLTGYAGLTGYVSLTSNGENPDQATVGDVVTAAATVTNNTSKKQAVTITITVGLPNGGSYSYSERVVLRPGQTYSDSLNYPITADYPPGTYTLTVSAPDGIGTSSGTASIVIN